MLADVLRPQIVKHIRKIRAQIIKKIRPSSSYSLLPISNKFGFDRGTPIDRYYIQQFMKKNQSLVRGNCLEIHDNAYTKQYGQDKVTHADVADIDTNNRQANIYVDLAQADIIPDNTYDTLIITHTLGLIPQHDQAIKHLHRILKPGGKLLLTVSAMGPFITNGNAYWRYTTKSIRYLLSLYFESKNIEVESFGNVLAGQASWVGLAAEELTQEQRDFNDERYPLVIAAVATK